MFDRLKMSDRASATIRSRRPCKDGLRLRGQFTLICRDKDGNIKWTETLQNLVVNSGIDEVLANGIGAPGALFIGLKLVGAPQPTDTLDLHPGWAEFTDYSGGNRLAWQHAGVTGQQATNVASPASFSITGPGDVTGAFLTDTQPNNNNTGILICAVDFSNGSKNVDNGDTLDVVYLFTGADDAT